MSVRDHLSQLGVVDVEDVQRVLDILDERHPHAAPTAAQVESALKDNGISPRYVPEVLADRILAYERLAKAILVDIRAALRSDGLTGLEDALAEARAALLAYRALTAEGLPA